MHEKECGEGRRGRLGQNARVPSRDVPSRAELLVLPSTPHTAGLIASPGYRSRLLYDAERRCLYAAETSTGVLQRFCDGPSGWVADGLSIAGLRDIALLPDGSQILAISANTLHYVDAASLVTARTQTGASIGVTSPLVAVAMTNSWEAVLMTDDYEFRIWRYGLASTSAQPDYSTVLQAEGLMGKTPSMAASLDGGLVVTGDLTGTLRLKLLGGIHGGGFTASVSTEVTQVTVDRTGSRIGAGGIIYDDSGLVLGDALSPAATVSPGGDRAYSIEFVDIYGLPILHTWDVTGVTGASIVELGTGAALESSPGKRGVTWKDENLLTMSLDGNTLFIEGPSGIVVVAVP